ncbi:hypothetical protein HanPSC8_Chr06g0259391 [Helianthus annuus]|nr:hypothetical protein HanPSC8_Chr06g0259391 [Helianthus annuus]
MTRHRRPEQRRRFLFPATRDTPPPRYRFNGRPPRLGGGARRWQNQQKRRERERERERHQRGRVTADGGGATPLILMTTSYDDRRW